VTTTLRIGNCSGFYGDRLSAMREMLEGGELDVLTGDYLAELTMLILGRDLLKDPSRGYARTFVRQLEDCLGIALDRGVRIVSNAGGLNPAGLAARVSELASGLGLTCRVAYVDGDDLLDRAEELGLLGERGKPLTANAYLGGFGIAAALTAGADVVVTGRVTDASLVVGPAVAHFGWGQTSYDELAGAVVAGHVLECGAHATGGNFSGFHELIASGRTDRPLGFPLAELAADGSCVVTKHPGTGGTVSVDTVTAQLLYEIQSTRYLGPDVTVDLSSVRLAQDGEDRVRVDGVVGEPPPSELKVCVNELGGWRNSVEFLLTGLELEAKAAWVRDQLEASWQERRPETVTWGTTAPPVEDASSQELAYSRLRCTVLDPSPEVAGKGLTGPAVELALASYPGFTLSAPPAPATPYGVFRACYVPRSSVPHRVHHSDGTVEAIAPPSVAPSAGGPGRPGGAAAASAVPPGTMQRLPLGTFVQARSGDKGGDANLGLWVSRRVVANPHGIEAESSQTRADAELVRRRTTWLLGMVTPEFVKELLPETEPLDVEVHRLPNLNGVNVLIRGLLGEGVAASTRVDPQAKALGEWARSRLVEIPEELL
jgi:hypothetical protein